MNSALSAHPSARNQIKMNSHTKLLLAAALPASFLAQAKNSSQEFLDYSVKIHAADIESCIRKLTIPMDIVGTPWVLDK